MATYELSPEIVNAAIEGFEQQKLRIEAQIGELRAMLPGDRTEPAATPDAPKTHQRRMSAAARKRMSDAQRKRWAVSKGPSESSAEAVAPKPKRKLSAAGRAAIVAALKKRWAAKKTAPAVSIKVATKKSSAKRLR